MPLNPREVCGSLTVNGNMLGLARPDIGPSPDPLESHSETAFCSASKTSLQPQVQFFFVLELRLGVSLFSVVAAINPSRSRFAFKRKIFLHCRAVVRFS